ncbi:MAG: LegC family aminotransferase [Candidatus Latescibacteria bacterium]|nr:LegC family aminotransferase [Candidatus Latescibacterota bacterium]MBT4137034.1 LegC family aminotransferase [Candidatus Latescibacterota bacterium]
MPTIVPKTTPSKAHTELPSIPLCIPEIRGNEKEYVTSCIETGWVSSVGTFVDKFEQQFADYLGAKHAIAMSSGTAALHIGLQLIGIQPNDEVLVSSLTFIATANAIRYMNAWPVFVDAESTYWQMDPQKLEDFIKKECVYRNGKLVNRTSQRRVGAILPVHILGHPCNLDEIRDIAERYNLPLIEDAAEALGTKYLNKLVGNDSELACFSFNGNKIMTTGGGGMLVTNNDHIAEKSRYYSTQAKDDPVEYIHEEVGYNYRLNNLQAALGYAQLEQLPDFITTKRQIAKTYTEAFGEIPGLSSHPEAIWAYHTHWLYTFLIDERLFGCDSRTLLRHLSNANIQTRPLWQPMHLSPAHKKCQSYYCEISEDLYKKALSLPCSVGLCKADQNRVIDTVLSIAQNKGLECSKV